MQKENCSGILKTNINKMAFCIKTGEEQLHLAANRRTEQTEGAPRAASQEEENPKYEYNRPQWPEDRQHAHTRHSESSGGTVWEALPKINMYALYA